MRGMQASPSKYKCCEKLQRTPLFGLSRVSTFLMLKKLGCFEKQKSHKENVALDFLIRGVQGLAPG